MTITAQIIADSISESGKRITTFEFEYPRIVHAEFMTHRVFSRNAASSRAIPFKTFIDLIDENPARPSHWGKNQQGMQASNEIDDVELAEATWIDVSKNVIKEAKRLEALGLHKQVVNRPLEAFQHIKVVVTATSYDNWFWLRNHVDADPTIHDLANVSLAAYEDGTPKLLLPGEWHLPYYYQGFWSKHTEDDFGNDIDLYGYTLSEALKISSSCCAQVSYRKLDDSFEKAEIVYARLVESTPCHASPTEHQATPVKTSKYDLYDDPELDDHKIEVNLKDDSSTWEQGITHVDRSGNFWSGNFEGWIQHRQLIPNHVCNNYQK